MDAFTPRQSGPVDTKVGKYETGCLSSPEKKLSLGSLITWNITKVLEACPYIDLKSALLSTQELMERDSQDGAPMMCLLPEEQHLAGAVSAWHRLGHGRAASLYEFIKSNLNGIKVVESVSSIKVVNCSISKIRSRITSSSSFDVKSITSITGPVVRLPLKTKFVMRVENNYQCQFDSKHLKSKQKNKIDSNKAEEKTKRVKAEVKNKLKAACTDFGIDKEHLPKLAELEEMILDLRTRVANLARRKAERKELLERTDVAWKDLELGYERRIKLAEEKTKDTEDQIKRILEERNGHKAECEALVEDLKKRSAEAEFMREGLTQVDKQVCGLACDRLRLSEDATQHDAAAAAEHCRLAQVDRELEFKEQAERRKIQYLESEISTARGLTIEAERATRSDKAAVQENLKQMTDEINKEKNKNDPLKAEIVDLQAQKFALSCELDNCKKKYDEHMQLKIDLLKSKKKELAALKGKFIDCQCRLPTDASTEAKRTPSLAANCACETDCNPKSCSCTSLRHELMSDLLGSLFEGLMSDLCATGSLMPCQLLKCLDDGHDWKRDSILRTNIHNYCSQLLVGELNIAITMTIENSYTKWLDGCGAFKGKLKYEVGERDLDARAKKLAAELAEQMLTQKIDDLTRKALQIVSSRVRTCHCKKEGNKASAVYPLLVKPPTTRKINDSSSLKRTMNDVAQLREQIEILKKETIGKGDLKVMEDKLTKIINRSPKSKLKNKNKDVTQIHLINDDKPERDRDAEPISNKDTIIMNEFEFTNVKTKFPSKSKATRIKQTSKKDFKNIRQPSTFGVYKCDIQPISSIARNVLKTSQKYKENYPEMLNLDDSKCTCAYTSNQGVKNDKEPGQIVCPKECTCIHKIPSNTSINKFLETLTKADSYCQDPKIPLDTKKYNSKDNTCFLNEETRPIVSEYKFAINLNKENENSHINELLNGDTTGFPESGVLKNCKGSESIQLEKSPLNSSTHINDSSCCKESKGENISAIGRSHQSCICCNDENFNTCEIEINALNLLKEHIKDKIRDLRQHFKYLIPADEEKNFYEDILKQIKKVISDYTFEILCKCSFENHEGGRQRAYNLLKEYLKIKIKRAHCSCITKYDHSEKLLTAILDKITELIENDIERLKIKYQEENFSKKCTGSLKKSEKEFKNSEKVRKQSVLINELDSCSDSECGKKKEKSVEPIDISAQVSLNFNTQHKSCDPVQSFQKYFDIDKQFTCTLNPEIYYNTNPIDEYEAFYRRNKPQKKDNKSAQVSFFFNSQNKLSDTIQNVGNFLSIDKKISCKLCNDVYVTDCNCRYNMDSNYEEVTHFDTRVFYFDIINNFF